LEQWIQFNIETINALPEVTKDFVAESQNWLNKVWLTIE
jgi:hypothetical protein